MNKIIQRQLSKLYYRNSLNQERLYIQMYGNIVICP